MARIGVFVCHCGENIARTVDVKRVAEGARGLPDVAFATDYTYMCSAPGQKILIEAVREHALTGVVVSACSPQLHEPTFRCAAAEAGLNPFLCEMANIREQCSWVHMGDRGAATRKAKDLVRSAVERARFLEAQDEKTFPVTDAAMVIGGGVAGIQAALELAAARHQVYLVERKASIGGIMSTLDKTYPTMDCSI